MLTRQINKTIARAVALLFSLAGFLGQQSTLAPHLEAFGKPRSARPTRVAEAPPRDTPVTLKGVSLKELTSMRTPKLIDVDPIDKQLGLALSGLEALTHMAKMVPEEHAQRALGAQIDALKASITALQKSLEAGSSVDYSVPPPPVLEPAPVSPSRAQRRVRPEPMSAVSLSQRWSALEAAHFRNEKMMVIRSIAREEYLTCEQAEVLIKSLSFSDDRRDALITLYTKLIDPDKVNDLYQLLDRSSDRRRARQEVDRINMHRRQTQGL